MPNEISKAILADHCTCGCYSDHSTIEQTLDFLRDAYSSQLTTCSLLENIADALPELPHECVSQTLVSLLQGSWAKQILVEEDKVYGLLEQHIDQSTFILNFINRLRLERQSDEDLASELITTLETILHRNTVPNPESFGYMLRGVFETKRRQVGLKKTVMLPLAEQTLWPSKR